MVELRTTAQPGVSYILYRGDTVDRIDTATGMQLALGREAVFRASETASTRAEFYRVTALPFGNPAALHRAGVSLWTFNDYRSDYPGTPPSGNREWGIVTEDRQPKAAYEQMRKLFSPVHSLTVTNGVIRLQPRGANEVPSFALRGYKLKWDGGEIALPDLKPGDPLWVSEKQVKPGTVVKLFTPTGYDVAESE